MVSALRTLMRVIVTSIYATQQEGLHIAGLFYGQQDSYLHVITP